MSDNDTGFKITDSVAGFNRADFNDVFINKNCFIEGNLWGWGCNSDGRLGNDDLINKSSPVQTISGGTNWKSISSGSSHTTAIKTDGTLWTWGLQASGSLGNNISVSGNISSPIQTIAGGNTWTKVSAGSARTAAIKTDGTLWLWGFNSAGVLGINSTVNASSPVQTILAGTNWKSVNIVCHTAAIKTDGTLWMWGLNSTGALGDTTIISKSTPIQTITGGTNWKQVTVSTILTAAVKTDGSLWLWGWGINGILGNESTLDRSSPVQTISAVNTWKQVSSGPRHLAAIKTDGTLWSWGNNEFGNLGNNVAGVLINVSSPIQTVSGGTNWREVSADGQRNTSAVKSDGTLWSWGRNINGVLGDNTTISKSTPIQTISGGTNWRMVEIGYNHTFAIRDNGYF